jgi:NAD(P) transhydrogenase
MSRYDLIVIGSGPAGHHAAIQGAKLGKSVLVVEAQPRLGGAGLTTGTVPSKALRELAVAVRRQPGDVLETWASAARGVMARCREIVEREVAVYRAQFARNGVEVLHGFASFVDPHTVHVERPGAGQDVEADVIVIATGTTPARSAAIKPDGQTIVDTDSVLDLGVAPRSLIIVGAGIVGVEYACTFAALGARVTLVDVRERLMPFVDHEIAEALGYQMREAGITLRLGERVDSVRPAEGRAPGAVALLHSRKELHAEVLLYAVGRQGSTAGLDLEAAGIEADERGRIPVNEDYQTRVPGIYAVGDVSGFPGLASVAMEQGRLAVCHAFARRAGFGRRSFPYGIYTIPEISFVGRTEQELTEAGVPYEVGIAHYREIARGQIRGDATGRLKLLFHREDGRLLGVHIIGDGATELIHIGQAVMNFGGTIDYFVENVFNYPTLAECYKVAALSGINRMAPSWEPEPPPALV